MKTKTEEARRLAERFHEAYERLAPQYGYTTRPETRKFDPESSNGKLMIAVIRDLGIDTLADQGEDQCMTCLGADGKAPAHVTSETVDCPDCGRTIQARSGAIDLAEIVKEKP
jgi:hypothetical protein